MISRRFILISPFVLATLPSCTTSTVNGVTTVTINLTSITAWGEAIANAATLLAPLTGALAPVIAAIAQTAQTDLAAVTASAGGAAVLTFATGSVPAAIESLLADGQTILTDISGLTGTTLNTSVAQTYVTALRTVVSVFGAAIGSASATPEETNMTEAQALTVLLAR